MHTFADHLKRYGPECGAAPALSVEEARRYCRRLTQAHYENFSVVSLLVPRRLRPHFCNVYAYCRWADDLADEVSPRERSLDLLDWWRDELDACFSGRARHPVFVALSPTIAAYSIPRQPFADLLVAFRQDQWKRRYETFEEVLEYCRYSAHPVGHLVLYLAGAFRAETVDLANQICTGLQLANFCQDVAADYGRGRIYLPLAGCRRFGYDETCFASRRINDAWRELLKFEVDRAESYLRAGRPLVARVPADLRYQVDLFVRGGLAILREIRRARYDVWTRRPVVSRWRKCQLVLGAATGRLKMFSNRH